MYTIGLFDDQESELRKIRRTINPTNNAEIKFENYAVPNQANLTALIENIKDDILNEKIHAMIIDYQIFAEDDFFNGADIYKEISESFPRFTTIILTQVIDKALEQTNIDSDKLYIKLDFFASGTDSSNKLVEKIFRNIDIYLKEKHMLEKQINILKDKIGKISDLKKEQHLIDEITCLESKLNEYIPTGLSEVEKRLKFDGIDKMLDLLEKAKKL